MFAIVLWDDSAHQLYRGARSARHQAVVLRASCGGRLVLASEAKTIARLPDFVRRMNDSACLDLLNVLATPSPTTLFDGIFKLGPGTSLRVDETANDIRSGDIGDRRRSRARPQCRPMEAVAEIERLARSRDRRSIAKRSPAQA